MSPDAPRPYTLIAELTYRCPLRCVYCSNPVQLRGKGAELDTATWLRVIEEAEQLGVLQLHLTGGEPLLRDDLEALVARAHELGLYVNLITSAIPLERERLARLQALGLDNVQISIQGTREVDAERIAGRAALAQKLQAARWVRELGLPLTLNVVLHRENIAQVPALVDLACDLGANRLELANTQYLGWALENRDALLPTAKQIEVARSQAREAADRLRGRMELLFVLPDYYSARPRACMDGWGRRYVLVSPDGLVLPCHQAHTIEGLDFDRVDAGPLGEIWARSTGLQAFRGEGFMQEPCKSCDRRTLDHGGCRCQAFHLTRDAAATDPACELSPRHEIVRNARPPADRALIEPSRLRYRKPP
ncbi:MAG: pyrroloquinoline quinone biosynthesis protein PqqE [Polyangiales bacterium]